MNIVRPISRWYETCIGDHSSEVPGVNSDSVNFLDDAQRGENQSYGNMYNKNKLNHPNFSWGGIQGQNPYQNQYLN